MKTKITLNSNLTKKYAPYLLTVLLSLTRVFGADLLNDPVLTGGEISYSPPFPMTHAVQNDSVAYVNGNNTAISFHVDESAPVSGPNGRIYFAETNAPSIEELKQALESESASGFIQTNVVAKIIKLDGREAVEIYGKKKGYFGVPDMWADTIVIFWHKGANWFGTTCLGIGISDVNEDVCQKLIESVKSAKYNPPGSIPVSGADLLNDPIFGGGQISYSPPFSMPHAFEGPDSVVYRIGDTAVNFVVQEMKPIHDKNGQNNICLKLELEQESVNAMQLTNIVAGLIKLDGQEAIEFSGERIGPAGEPMRMDIITIFWHQDTLWSKSKILCVAAVTDEDKDVFQKLIKSVKDAKYQPPK